MPYAALVVEFSNEEFAGQGCGPWRMSWEVAGGADENSAGQKFAVGTGATRVFTTSAATSGVFGDAANGRRALGSCASTM